MCAHIHRSAEPTRTHAPIRTYTPTHIHTYTYTHTHTEWTDGSARTIRTYARAGAPMEETQTRLCLHRRQPSTQGAPIPMHVYARTRANGRNANNARNSPPARVHLRTHTQGCAHTQGRQGNHSRVLYVSDSDIHRTNKLCLCLYLYTYRPMHLYTHTHGCAHTPIRTSKDARTQGRLCVHRRNTIKKTANVSSVCPQKSNARSSQGTTVTPLRCGAGKVRYFYR